MASTGSGAGPQGAKSGLSGTKQSSKSKKNQKKSRPTMSTLGKRTTAGAVPSQRESEEKSQNRNQVQSKTGAVPRYVSSASDDDSEPDSDSAYQSEHSTANKPKALEQVGSDEDDEDEDNLPLMSTNLALIRSDEIDGPTDFTENMEYWMKLRLPSVKIPVSMEEGEQREILEEWIASDPVNADDSAEIHDQEAQNQKAIDQAPHLVIIRERDALIKHLESELRESRRKNDLASRELLATNDRLEKDLRESRRATEDLQTELTTIRNSTEDKLSRREDAFRAELERVKLELRQESQKTSKLSNPSTESDQNGEIAKLNDLIENKNATINTLQKDMRSKMDSHETILRDKDIMIKKLEGNIQELRDQMNNLHSELTQSHSAHSELQLQLDNAISESRIGRESLEEEHKEATKREKTLRQALERAEKRASEADILKVEIEELERIHEDMEREKSDMEKKIESMRQKAETAVRKAGELLEKERREVQRLKAELDERREGEGDLRNELLVVNDQAEDASRERDDMRTKLTKVVDALEKEQKNAENARTDLKVTQIELSKVKEELVDIRSVNEEAERRMTEVIAEREKEWKRRLGELKAEMELRSKLLMIEWGRREVGDTPASKSAKGMVQGYKYMFRSGEFVME